MLGELLIREITCNDAAAAASLTAELGYPVDSGLMKQRIEVLMQRVDHIVYVACLSGEVVGWIDVRETYHLQSGLRAEIGGLVVSSKARSEGIGRHLVACAEQWARLRGLKSVVVLSRLEREKAHRFYLREGYAQTKTSAVFTKTL